MTNELVFAKLDDGRIKTWIRRSTIISGIFHMPYFYTAFDRQIGMVHSLMMDDFGNLVHADPYALKVE